MTLRHRLPAILLLLVLIFRISFGWADLPGACHHAAPAHAGVAEAGSAAPHCHGEVPPCHAQPDAVPCHGDHPAGSEAGCGCGCCHVAAAMISSGLVVEPAPHDSAVASAPPADLSYTPIPVQRPPIL